CFAGYLGLNQHAGVAQMLRLADFVLVLGSRLDEPTTNEYQLPGIFADTTRAGEVAVDFDWAHVYPSFSAIKSTPTAPCRIEAEAHAVIAELASLCDKQSSEPAATNSQWFTECRQRYEASLQDAFDGKFDPELLNLPRLMRELNALLDDDAIITTDAGNFTLWPQRLRQYKRPGRFIAPISGAMGFGVPSGIAASLAFPESTVVSFVGDGGMLMTGMEIATAMQYGAKPIIIVFNNALYGTIDSHQTRQYPGREHGNQLYNPDFAALAESFGAAGVAVRTVEDFANAFLQAKQLGELAIIELILH
ncbi:MAG: thiamine pyrophosphate-dependent enzyme, partial [Gammaproteobacteria bacterium]